MPFKSEAQRRKFRELVADGKISEEEYRKWDRETGAKKLPDRIRPKSKTRPRTS